MLQYIEIIIQSNSINNFISEKLPYSFSFE